MRIAFVTDTYEDGIAGGVVSAVRFVEALRRHHDVTVLATGAAAAGKVVLPGFRVPIHAMHANRFTFGWPSRGIMREVFARADVVHVNFPFPLGFAAVRLARRMGVPVVAAFHVQPENMLMNIGLSWQPAADWLYRYWVNGFFERADAVVCPSEFAAERLRAFGLTRPTHIVSNGTRGGRTRAALRTADRRSQRFLILCVGRLAREKRQDVVIDAVARSRHRDRIDLVIAGAGPLREQLEQRALSRGLQVEFGYVSDERLAQLYADAHLFIHASEVELEGMAVLEAMGAGLPALLADAPDSASRAFATGPDFLFRAGDPADLAAHIDALVENPGLLGSGARRGSERARQHDFADSTRSLEQVYASVIKRTPPDRRERGVA